MNNTLPKQIQEASAYRMTPILEIPENAHELRWILTNGRVKEVEHGVQVSLETKHDQEYSVQQFIVNKMIVASAEGISSADMNQDGKVVYTYQQSRMNPVSVITWEIYNENHEIIPLWSSKDMVEAAPTYDSIIQWPFVTNNGKIIIFGSKEKNGWDNIYIDHQKIPLDIDELLAPIKIEGNNLFISFKTPGWVDRITQIELDNSRERPKKGHYLIEGYRALTQKQVAKITSITEQRDDLVKLHDDKITKLTDKDAEIAQILKLLKQEKEKTDALSERIDELENTIARQKEAYQQDLSDMTLAHWGIVTVVNESLIDLWKTIEKPWTFWGNLKEQAKIATERIQKAITQIRHAI